jgi:RNA polymerase sigma factor (sigma-70 family)
MAHNINQGEDERGREARRLVESQSAFFERYWPPLVHFLAAQASSYSLAEEVAAEAFLRACVRWDKLLTYDRPDSWLFKVAVRELRRQEAQARARGTLSEDLAGNVADLQRAAETDEWVAENFAFAAAVRTLPRRQAEVVSFAMLGYTTKETAGTLGISEGTARSHLSRASGNLRVLLNDAEVPGVARRDPS